jgi:hypothetical protein
MKCLERELNNQLRGLGERAGSPQWPRHRESELRRRETGFEPPQLKETRRPALPVEQDETQTASRTPLAANPLDEPAELRKCPRARRQEPPHLRVGKDGQKRRGIASLDFPQRNRLSRSLLPVIAAAFFFVVTFFCFGPSAVSRQGCSHPTSSR